MDEAYISTLAALAGTLVGGLTSFATSWLVQHSQARAQRLAAERAKREELYGRFLDETATLYSHALSEERVDYARLVSVFALRGRICLCASAPVFQAADASVKYLVDLTMAPNRTAAEVRALMDNAREDVMRAFAESCREELRRLR